MSIKTEQRLITPELASELLNHNDANRPLRAGRVEFIAQAIKRGEWKVTHQPIAISPSGRVLDGQHRLWAIVESGIACEMLVATDVPENTFDCIDLGTKRSITDILGGDKRVNDTCMVFLRTIIKPGNSVATPQSLRPYIEAYGPTVERLLSRAVVKSKGLNNSAIRAAVVLRMTQSDEQEKYCLAQYPAFLLRDYPKLSPMVQAFLRQIDGSARIGNHQWELAARAWVAFDLARKDVNRVTITKPIYSIEEMRELVRKKV